MSASNGPPQRSDFQPSGRNPFASDVASAPTGALANAEQQRSIAEVQARMIIARANPRDPLRAMDLILRDCTRPTLAMGALYQYSRGGSSVSGPSIRLAEAIAQRWGNIASGIKEISRAGGYSECVAYAWDLESGYYDERQFQVRHWRDTRQGGHPLIDERDIYELIANMGQRRKRAVMLTVIPGDVVEAAVEQCEATLSTTADTSPQTLARVAVAFEQFGVTRSQIERRCQCHLDSIRPAQLVQLRKIYASLKDGMSDAKDWFEATNGVWAATEEAHAANRPQSVSEKASPKNTQPPQWDGDDVNGTEPARRDPPEGMRVASPSLDTHGSPELDEDAAKLQAMGADPGPTLGDIVEAPKFSVWLVDGEGNEIPDADGIVAAFTNPLAFARAYMEAIDAAFPGDRELMIKANSEALEHAAIQDHSVTEEIMAWQDAKEPAKPSTQIDPAFIPPPTKSTKAEFTSYVDRFKVLLAGCTTIEAIDHLGSVNAATTKDLPNSARVAIRAATEARRAEINPPEPEPWLPFPEPEPPAKEDDIATQAKTASDELSARLLSTTSIAELAAVEADQWAMSKMRWLLSNAPYAATEVKINRQEHKEKLERIG